MLVISIVKSYFLLTSAFPLIVQGVQSPELLWLLLPVLLLTVSAGYGFAAFAQRRKIPKEETPESLLSGKLGRMETLNGMRMRGEISDEEFLRLKEEILRCGGKEV